MLQIWYAERETADRQRRVVDADRRLYGERISRHSRWAKRRSPSSEGGGSAVSGARTFLPSVS
jgi:hypothetical protein